MRELARGCRRVRRCVPSARGAAPTGGWPRIPLARRDGLAQDCVLGGRALLDACRRTCRRHGYVIAQGCIPEKCARGLACSLARPRAPLSSLSSAEWRMP